MYSKLPPKGMRDFLPAEKAVRDEVEKRIRGAYISSGFTPVETSFIENLPNLTQGDGGENQKLIFKILKRGEKLDLSNLDDSAGEDSLADLGLRFDFTLPLVRFYSNNRNELPQIFKGLQMGYVFRGERPQRGRYRAFTQCDVDIIGDESNLAEIEVIGAVIRALEALEFKGFEIKINDRRFLTSLILKHGFDKDSIDDVCISLDKLDKIERDGVFAELTRKGYSAGHANSVLDAISGMNLDDIKEYSADAHANISQIQQALEIEGAGAKVVFEPTLVRGMGYYTGTIFEIFSSDFPLALGGGGRYDKMIGKISGADQPAVGFSLGFERICDLLNERGFGSSEEGKTAVIVSSEDQYPKAIASQSEIISRGGAASIYIKKKKFGRQLSQLARAGYNKYLDLEDGAIKSLEE